MTTKALVTKKRTKGVDKNALHTTERREISLRLNVSFKGLAEASMTKRMGLC